MSDVKLGQIIQEPQQRDAIHIAVAPVLAAETLVPGEHVGFVGLDPNNREAPRAAKKTRREAEVAFWLDAMVGKGDLTRETRDDGKFYYGLPEWKLREGDSQ